METFVKYGFGNNNDEIHKLFLTNCGEIDDGEIFVEENVCFSNYIRKRTKYIKAINNSVYYSLSCNYGLLKELVDHINSLDCGISIQIIKKHLLGELVGYTYERQPYSYTNITKYSDFAFGIRYAFRKTDKDGLKTLPIHRCTIKIDIKGCESNETKILLEYLLLVVIRVLDYKEEFYEYMPTKEGILNKILKASADKFNGHSIIDEREVQKKVNEKVLTKLLSVENANKCACPDDIDRYRQTDIVKLFLNGV